MSRTPLKLPLPPGNYDRHYQDVTNRELEASDENNQKKYEPYYLTTPRVVGPDGYWWEIKVTRDGQLYAKAPQTGILDDVLDSMTLTASGTVV